MNKASWKARIFKAGDARGFSMTELIMALGIAVVAAVGLYSVYISQQKQSSSQRLYSDLQNDLRFAIDYMKNELFLAGYKATNPDQPIATANANTITFEYWDDNGQLDPPYDQHILVSYSLVADATGTNNLVRTQQKYNTLTSPPNPQYDPSTTVTEVLARHVTGLNFSYRMGDNTAYTIGTSNPEDIRTIRISLSGRSRKPDPSLKSPSTGLPYHRTLTLTGEVKSRNLAISSNPADSTPPAVPTGLNVWDPGNCERLMLEWDANTEADLAGYTIFYGLSSGAYSGRKTVSRGPGAGKESYTLTGLQSLGAPYYITIQAYDRSANVSTLAAEISGNPDPSVTTSGGANDTAIDPAIPEPPAALTAETPSDGKVRLSWTSSPTAGVVGYRLFRARNSDFSDEVLIAAENQLKSDVLFYEDEASPVNELLGCVTYYYRIAAIHCDPSQFSGGNYVYPDHYAEVSAAPTDTVPPRVPDLIARPGYRRIILNLTNPLKDATNDPDFAYTEIYQSTAGFPTVDAGGVVTGGVLVPDYYGPGASPGRFTAPGSVPPSAGNFDSESVQYPSEPELQADTTYYFLAVAYDQCGNHTLATSESLAEGQQCGDCDPTEVCYEAPPYPTGIATAGCADSLRLDWDTIDQVLYRDLAGFRVFRQESTFFDDGLPSTDLTGGTSTWFTYWEDSTTGVDPMVVGKAYSYKICATDCYYEQHSGKSPGDWPDPANDPDDNIACTTINNVYVGNFWLSNNKFFAQTGDLVTTPRTYRHDTVTFYIDNRAAGNLNQTAIRMLWEDPGLFLQNITIGDNATTSEELVAYYIPPKLVGQTANYDNDKAIDGKDLDVPMEIGFTRSDGTVDATIDLREETLDINPIFITNPSTGSTNCRQWGTVHVPLGPAISGVVQNQPSNPTLAWPVPGDQGTNFMDRNIVPGGVDVHVLANVRDTSLAGLHSVNLRYHIDSGAVLTTPPDETDFSISSAISMSNVAGDLWATDTPIPDSDGANIWYYIVAIDLQGNFDRAPEIDSGAYQYYQEIADVCENIPNAPPTLSGTTGASSVTLTWTAPTLNDNGSTFIDSGGYNVYRNDGTGWSLHHTESDPATMTFVDSIDSADLAANNYSYYVTVLDTCHPNPNESPSSPAFTECTGAPACIFNVVPSNGTPVHPGDSFDIDLAICTKQDGLPGEVIYAQVCTAVGGTATGGADADPVELVEIGDTGLFRVNAGLYGRDNVRTWTDATYPASPSNVDLLVDETSDTVTVGAWSSVPYSNSFCESGSFVCGEETFSVTADPCANPSVPDAPTAVLAAASGTCASTRIVDLSWVEPASGADSYNVYMCTGAGCSPTTLMTQTANTSWSGGDGGKITNNVYRFAVSAVNTVGGICAGVEGPLSFVAEEVCD